MWCIKFAILVHFSHFFISFLALSPSLTTALSVLTVVDMNFSPLRLRSSMYRYLIQIFTTVDTSIKINGIVDIFSRSACNQSRSLLIAVVLHSQIRIDKHGSYPPRRKVHPLLICTINFELKTPSNNGTKSVIKQCNDEDQCSITLRPKLYIVAISGLLQHMTKVLYIANWLSIPQVIYMV